MYARLASVGLVVGAAVVLSAGVRADDKPLLHEWREVGKNHWQIVTPEGEPPEVTDAAEGTRGECPPGMVEIKGKMRVTAMGDLLERSVCSNWINRKFPERCAAFAKDKWEALRNKLPTRDMHFCIDRFEYPNRKGEYPVIYVDWFDAKKMCADQGKRLCTEDEWTFACEGDEALPYPYGYDRDADACLVDKPWRWFDPAAYGTRKAALVRELDRLWQGVPAGSLPKCKSPFGVYDTTGNVDEYTTSLSSRGSPAILKGGYWGPVRTRCRPSTRVHGPEHAFYQQGFRCCRDGSAPAPSAGK
ncbi:MAG TPA: SUMF1/EgtB/PvdO family nonheme iron enzyme [Polyangiaceae bacterium]|nr:SUMF1/EgtB/PvdO family nonheme iron enzyme [Polyangiaceae bacterium]